MGVTGGWVLHYDWGRSNSNAQSNTSLNPNGTFGGDLPGKWVQQDGTLLLSYDTGPAKYGGMVAGNVDPGASSTFDSSNAARHKQSHDAAGNSQ